MENERLRARWLSREVLREEYYKKYYAQADLLRKDYASAALQSWLSIFHRHYWTRLWVLQKFVLAEKLMLLCGDMYMDRTKMQDFYLGAAAGVNCEEMFGPANALLKIRFKDVSAWNRKPRPSFHSAIMASARLQCFDPRDKIFGILGIAWDAPRTWVVDYSMPAAEVFWDAFENLKPLRGASWELNNADPIYELA